MRRPIAIAGTAVAIGVAVYAGFFHKKAGVLAQDDFINVKPASAFTAVLVEELSRPGEAPKQSLRITIAKSSDGKWRHENIQTVGYQTQKITIKQPDGIQYTLFPNLKAKVSYQHPPSEYGSWVSGMPDPNKNCLDSYAYPQPTNATFVLAAKEYKYGLAVYKVVDKLDNPTLTMWRSPQLHCIEVETFQQWPESTSAKKLLSYSIGEPPATLFTTDDEFTEMKPTGVETLRVQRNMPNASPEVMNKHVAQFNRLDDYYEKHRLQ